MKIISFDDIRALDISPLHCYDWVNEMIADKQSAFLPPKTHMNMPGVGVHLSGGQFGLCHVGWQRRADLL